ncbi:MAG: GGDEF domain-containing protein [Nitriliruptoraceae bacterium]|nr:GGDEF domain-containing protein [Nitriliruptoraceae bacterium]
MSEQATVTADFEARFLAAWQRRIAHPVDALDAALALAEEVAGVDDPVVRTRILLLEGSCRWRIGDYAIALKRLLACLEIVPEDRPRERAAVLADLGVVRNYFGEADTATFLLLESLALREAVGDEAGQGDVLNNLGIVRYHRGQLAEAASHYRDAASIRARIGDDDGLAAVRNNLGKVLTDQGEHALALEALQAAIEGWERLDNVRGLGMAHNNVGLVHLARGERDTARACFERSLALKAEVADRHGSCETLVHLGRLAAGEGDHDRALALLEQARTQAVQLGLKPLEVEATAAIADVHETWGDHASALVWFRRFHAAERAMFDARAAERLQALQIAHRLDRAEREGVTDPLTGLANRRGFERRLHGELERADRDGTQLTVALLDLDDFKQVNDRFGHQVGDEVLRRVADLLTDHTRAADLPARYGGEEFALLLPATDRAAALAAAQAACARIRSHDWSRIDPGLAITVSIGLATATEQDIAAARSQTTGPGPTLLERADRHLYAAKHAGKDRVRA